MPVGMHVVSDVSTASTATRLPLAESGHFLLQVNIWQQTLHYHRRIDASDKSCLASFAMVNRFTSGANLPVKAAANSPNITCSSLQMHMTSHHGEKGLGKNKGKILH